MSTYDIVTVLVGYQESRCGRSGPGFGLSSLTRSARASGGAAGDMIAGGGAGPGESKGTVARTVTVTIRVTLTTELDCQCRTGSRPAWQRPPSDSEPSPSQRSDNRDVH